MSISSISNVSNVLNSINGVLSSINKGTQGGGIDVAKLGDMFQSLGSLVGSGGASNVAKQPSISDLFGNNALESDQKKKAEAAKAAAAGGGAMSLGALLA